MKTRPHTLRIFVAATFFAVSAFVISCKKDADPISGDVSASVSNEATQDSQQDEVDDMATGQLNVKDNAGRFATTADGRTACAKLTFSNVSDDLSSGTLTINFDSTSTGVNASGCTDARGNVRKGKLIIGWDGGRWFKVNSVITITMDNYSINGVVINGSRILSNITDNVLKPTWTIIGESTTTWPDATTSVRTVNKTRQWDIAAGTLTVTQSAGAENAATGTTRAAVTYAVQITAPLVYKISCIGTSKVYIAVSGTKTLTFDSKVVTIDFGTGDCDNSFTVSFDGKSKTITGTN